MRVISKFGEEDIPYELSIFWRDETVIWATIPGFGKIIMAQYSSQEKAEKAMQMLHECYTGMLYMQNVVFGKDVDVKERLKESMRQGIGFISVIDRKENVKIEPMNIVFRFPREDEV